MSMMKVRLEFLTEVLGTSSGDPNIHETYISSKAEDAMKLEEEVASLGVEKVIENAMTVFPKLEDGTPIFWDYQFKGFFKDACSALQRCKGEDCAKESNKLKAYKKIIDGCIFTYPRRIPIDMHGGEISGCERPLRASTAQGERIALANSETVPAGSTVEFEIECLSKAHEKAVLEWLDYGITKGMGQWRNSGKGRFLYDILDDDDNVIGGNNEARPAFADKWHRRLA